MDTELFFALVGLVYALAGLVFGFNTKDEADSEKTRNTIRLWACLVLCVAWIATSELKHISKSLDAFRIQEAQNACPCVAGEEGE